MNTEASSTIHSRGMNWVIIPCRLGTKYSPPFLLNLSLLLLLLSICLSYSCCLKFAFHSLSWPPCHLSVSSCPSVRVIPHATNYFITAVLYDLFFIYSLFLYARPVHALHFYCAPFFVCTILFFLCSILPMLQS